MNQLNAFYRLMRLDKPIGILLLWWPTAWALWIANDDKPSWLLLLYFFCGTIIMRSAGCVINDIADREFDKYVKRTQFRPLTSGEVELKDAMMLFILLLSWALLILLQLPTACIVYAITALVITVIYPFCKRWISAPQLVLGLAFSMGIPMSYSASMHPFDITLWILILINFCWIVAYDTIYAMVDREDDLKIGIQSTAIWFGSYDRLIVAILQVTAHFLWGMLAFFQPLSVWFWGCWVIALINLIYQQWLINVKRLYFKAFLSNAWYGFYLWLGLLYCAR